MTDNINLNSSSWSIFQIHSVTSNLTIKHPCALQNLETKTRNCVTLNNYVNKRLTFFPQMTQSQNSDLLFNIFTKIGVLLRGKVLRKFYLWNFLARSQTLNGLFWAMICSQLSFTKVEAKQISKPSKYGVSSTICCVCLTITVETPLSLTKLNWLNNWCR